MKKRKSKKFNDEKRKEWKNEGINEIYFSGRATLSRSHIFEQMLHEYK
jgi:hypothetical protein